MCHTPRKQPKHTEPGFTLAEVLVALSLLSVSLALIYQFAVANMTLAVKNTSLNNTNTSLQKSYNKLLTGLEGAAMFVDCANYNPATKTFAPVANGTWANSVRFMRRLPMTAYILPVDNSGYTVVNPPNPLRLVYYPADYSAILINFNSALYKISDVPPGARLFLNFPNVTENVTTGSSPGIKPGLGIASMDSSLAAVANGLTILKPTNPIQADTVQDCNRAYFMIESAFVVIVDPQDGHKSLLYFDDTSKTSAPLVINANLDAANQYQANDTSIPANGTAGTFSMNANGETVQALLPIRDREFTNVLTRNGGAVARNNAWLNINTKFRLRQEL